MARCDSCGPAVEAMTGWAKLIALPLEDGSPRQAKSTLDLCGHHSNRHALRLVGEGWTKIFDNRPVYPEPAEEVPA